MQQVGAFRAGRPRLVLLHGDAAPVHPMPGRAPGPTGVSPVRRLRVVPSRGAGPSGAGGWRRWLSPPRRPRRVGNGSVGPHPGPAAWRAVGIRRWR